MADVAEMAEMVEYGSELRLIAARSLHRIRLKDWLGKPIQWRGSQVVRQGSAKALFAGSIPALASISNGGCSKELRGMESQLSVKLSVNRGRN